LGVETIWVADHLADRRGQLRYHGWTCLAGLAEQTVRARIGTLVSPMTLHNPAVLAKAALTVDHASGGRLELGLGTGGSDQDVQLAGVQSPTDDDFRGFVRRVLAFLEDESLGPSPLQERIPLTLGGNTSAILRLAAEVGDRWNTYGGRGLSAEEGLHRSRDRNAELDRYCGEAGRDPRTVIRSALIGYPFVAETPWRSEALFQEFVQRWGEAGFDELIFYYPPDLGHAGGERRTRTVRADAGKGIGARGAKTAPWRARSVLPGCARESLRACASGVGVPAVKGPQITGIPSSPAWD